MIPCTVLYVGTGGRSSVVRASEFKSEDSGFDPLAGGMVRKSVSVPSGQLLRRLVCAWPPFVCKVRTQICTHAKDLISMCRKRADGQGSQRFKLTIYFEFDNIRNTQMLKLIWTLFSLNKTTKCANFRHIILPFSKTTNGQTDIKQKTPMRIENLSECDKFWLFGIEVWFSFFSKSRNC